MKKLTAVVFIFIFLSFQLFSDSVDDNISISVLYFSNNSSSPDLAWLEKGIADMLTTDLAGSSRIKTVEREELEKILQEQRLNLSGLVDDDERLELGKLLKADYLITGSFIFSGNIVRFDCKVLDTETGALSAAVKAENSLENLFAAENDLAVKIIKSFDFEVPPELAEFTSKSAAVSVPSIAAAESYYKGLNFFDSREYKKAIEYYKHSSALDPLYESPRRGIEDSYRFLKDFKQMRMHREINKLLGEADVLRKRLERKEWLTYADYIMISQENGSTDYNEINKKAEELGLFRGNTRAECTWNLQVKLFETSMRVVEYFNDKILDKALKTEVATLSASARKQFPDDPFLPEIIYQELLAVYLSGNYEFSIVICEEIMTAYPDFRMISSVEDFYSNSLEKISD